MPLSAECACALAMTDHNSLTAAVMFNACCKEYSIRPIFGTEVTLEDGSHLTLLAKSRVGYLNICKPSWFHPPTACGGRLTPELPWASLPGFTSGVVCLSGCRKGKLSQLIRSHRFDDALKFGRELREWFGENLFIELQDDLTPHSRVVCGHLAMLARHLCAECVATNNVHYATREGMVTHDIKRCIARGLTVADVHPDRPLNGERYLKSAGEMAAQFAWHPSAIANSERIAESCAQDGILPLGEEVTPKYPLPGGVDSSLHLRALAYQGARRRRGSITATGRERLDDELMLLSTLGYCDFVLHAARIVRWARSQGHHGGDRARERSGLRGMLLRLRLTDIDVLARNLPVARWIVRLVKKPDIDIDFDARYRDDVFRWIAKTYGEEMVALCCTYATYWAKGAIRDVGKALALPPDSLTWFSKHVSGFTSASDIAGAFKNLPELKDYAPFAERYGLLFDLCGRISGHPRHLGSHSSGLVIGGMPLAELNVVTPSARGVVPIVMLDKDDVEEAGAVKLDILSLPILSVVRDTARDIQKSDPDFDYEAIPREDRGVYQMLWSGQNMGLFQLGSPAQAALATQLHPRDFEDLVASIGLIRPGPIKAHAVKKYVAARNGYNRIEYLHPSLIPILERTYGVVCFQEQVSYIISAMMGLSDADGEVWRKKLAKHARFGTMDKARAEFVGRACSLHANLPPRNAHQIMDELEGWSSLGFVEGHSASFALTGQKTADLMRYHPAEYYAALMSNQPCVILPPPQSLRHRKRGVAGCGLAPSISTTAIRAVSRQLAKTERRCVWAWYSCSGPRDQDIEAILAASPGRGAVPLAARLLLYV